MKYEVHTEAMQAECVGMSNKCIYACYKQVQYVHRKLEHDKGYVSRKWIMGYPKTN